VEAQHTPSGQQSNPWAQQSGVQQGEPGKQQANPWAQQSPVVERFAANAAPVSTRTASAAQAVNSLVRIGTNPQKVW
jgi:hypothetical protein